MLISPLSWPMLSSSKSCTTPIYLAESRGQVIKLGMSNMMWEKLGIWKKLED